MRVTLIDFGGDRYDVSVANVLEERSPYSMNQLNQDRFRFILVHPEMNESFAVGDRVDAVLSTESGETDLSTHPPKFSRDAQTTVELECVEIETSARGHWLADTPLFGESLTTVLEEYDADLVDDDDDSGSLTYSKSFSNTASSDDDSVPEWYKSMDADDVTLKVDGQCFEVTNVSLDLDSDVTGVSIDYDPDDLEDRSE